MNKSNTKALIRGVFLFAVLQTAAWAHSPEAGLRACASIANDDDRLRCFDVLAAETEPAPAAVAETPPAAASPAPAMPEPTGAAVPEAADSAPAAPEAVAAATAAPEAVAAAPAAAAPPPEIEPVSDEFGIERIQREEERAERTEYAAKVTRCDENRQSGQYYFFLENGQVWKQANYKRLYWRSCEFDVTISKGKLGYDMYIPEKDRSVRVARIR